MQVDVSRATWRRVKQGRRERGGEGKGGYNYVGKLKRASSAMRQFVQHLNGRAEALTKVLEGEESAANTEREREREDHTDRDTQRERGSMIVREVR